MCYTQKPGRVAGLLPEEALPANYINPAFYLLIPLDKLLKKYPL